MSQDSRAWMRPVRRWRRRLFPEDDPVNCRPKGTTVTPENGNIPVCLNGPVRTARRERRRHPLELVPVNVMAQLLNQDPFSYSDLVPALGRGRHPLELIPVNLMEQLLNNVLDSDDSVLTPHHEPCQQSRDSPDLEPVDVMENFLNC